MSFNRNSLALDFLANKDIRRNVLDVVVALPGSQGAPPSFGLPIAFRQQESEGEALPPTISLPFGAAEALMTELWVHGIRPGERFYSGPGDGIAIANHIASLQAEITFLRGMVSHQMGIVK